MSKPKKDGYEYWVDEVNNGLDDITGGQIRAGRALWKLHGPKGQRANQLWKTDPEADGLVKFTDYCQRKFPLMSWQRAYQYMKAYEEIEMLRQDEEADFTNGESTQADFTNGESTQVDAQKAPVVDDQKATVGGFPEPKSERVLRPLTKLKTEVDKKRAWKLANQNKKGNRVTSRDTANAVQEVLTTNAIGDQRAKQMAKEIHHGMRSETELQQYANEGISTVDAFKKVHASWTALIKDEDDERAINKLATTYIEYLSNKYSIEG